MASINDTAAKDGKRDVSSHHVEQDADADGDLKHTDAAIDAATKGQALTGYEHLSLWETAKTFKICAACCFAAAFSGGNDGYQIGINASIIVNKGFIEQFATAVDAKGKKYHTSPILSGWSSIMSVGQVIGTVSISFVLNRFGRKAAMYWIWIVLVASVLAESLSRTWQVWLIGKLLAGIGVGSLQATLPTYIAEISPDRIRGALCMLYQFWWTVGSFFAQIALREIDVKTPMNWLIPVYTQWGQIGVMAIIFLLIPETPQWCVAKGREAQAKKCIRTLHWDIPNYDVDRHYQRLVLLFDHEKQVAEEQRRQHWWAIFVGTDGRRTFIALWPSLAQQFIGLKLFGTFATYFFQQAGVGEPFTIKCITTSIKIATVLVAISATDTIGRRLMACGATTLSWVCCIIVGILGVVPDNSARTYVFVASACLWNVGMVAVGAASSASLGEISSQRLRPYTAGFAMGSSCVVGIIMDVLVPYMVNSNQWNWSLKTGWFYAGLGLIGTVVMWLMFPETKGRSAAELDELFENKTKAWKFKTTKTATQRLAQEQA